MTSSLEELIAQREAIDRQIRSAKSSQRAGAVAQIRQLMQENGLSIEDVAQPRTSKKAATAGGKKVAPKYRDPVSGATWSGRGLKPKWLVSAIGLGRQASEFAV